MRPERQRPDPPEWVASEHPTGLEHGCGGALVLERRTPDEHRGSPHRQHAAGLYRLVCRACGEVSDG